MSQREDQPKKSLIPWLFVLGFAVIIAANGVMISVAISTFPDFAEGYLSPKQKAQARND